jgi:hypothetical protein
MRDLKVAIIVIFIFSIVDGLTTYIQQLFFSDNKTGIYYSPPEFFINFKMSLLIVILLYVLYYGIKQLLHRRVNLNVCLMGFLILSINIIIIYSVIIPFLGLSEAISIQNFLRLLCAFGINFFIPFVDIKVETALR